MEIKWFKALLKDKATRRIEECYVQGTDHFTVKANLTKHNPWDVVTKIFEIPYEQVVRELDESSKRKNSSRIKTDF